MSRLGSSWRSWVTSRLDGPGPATFGSVSGPLAIENLADLAGVDGDVHELRLALAVGHVPADL
jgi:hypothetical protein